MGFVKEGSVKSIFFRRTFVILMLLAAVLLAACERQIQEEATPSGSPTVPVSTPAILPTTDPALVPTTDPALIPTIDPALVPTTDPAAQPTVDPGTGAQITPPATGQSSYTVVAGDTLFSIATDYGISIAELAAANNLDQNGLLTPGQVLVIPAAGGGVAQPTAAAQPTTTAGERVHVVAAGENLFRIGLRYGFTVAELAAYNNIANPNFIEVGQVILIPPGGNP
jgi:LysM repeat protein